MSPPQIDDLIRELAELRALPAGAHEALMHRATVAVSRAAAQLARLLVAADPREAEEDAATAIRDAREAIAHARTFLLPEGVPDAPGGVAESGRNCAPDPPLSLRVTCGACRRPFVLNYRCESARPVAEGHVTCPEEDCGASVSCSYPWSAYELYVSRGSD